MATSWIAALEATSLAGALRNSTWVYPLINAGHILGIALLIGAMVPLDLRLLGVWRSAPLAPLWRVLSRTAAVGLMLTISCGALLFITRATAYVESGFFLSKMVVVGSGAINALALQATVSDAELTTWNKATRLPVRARLAALISLTAWLTALTLGRFVGYF